VVIATGVTADGGREVLGLDVGDSEDGAFWTAFLRSLKASGLTGVQLVISDAHTGLKAAIAAVMAGASWQRCRVHFLRNVLARVPRGSAEMVAAASNGDGWRYDQPLVPCAACATGTSNRAPSGQPLHLACANRTTAEGPGHD
jgi:hypothetical protein